MRKFLTIRQIADRYCVSPGEVKHKIKTRKLKAHGARDRAIRIDEKEVDKIFKSK